MNLDFVFQSSIIENFNDFSYIHKEICRILNNQDIKYNLVYKASKNGDDSKSFHKKCDNIGPNISIIKTKKGIVFGGFTVENWGGDGDKKDDNAFCFNMNFQKIYKNSEGFNALDTSSTYLICFNSGIGASIIEVPNKCLNHEGNTCQTCESKFIGMKKNYEINNYERYFKVDDLEVFEIKY